MPPTEAVKHGDLILGGRAVPFLEVEQGVTPSALEGSCGMG